MKERIVKNWITTVIGIAIFAVSVWFVKGGEMPWYGLIPMGVFSGWFIRAKHAAFKEAFDKLNLNK
jgi:hypothetical protein